MGKDNKKEKTVCQNIKLHTMTHTGLSFKVAIPEMPNVIGEGGEEVERLQGLDLFEAFCCCNRYRSKAHFVRHRLCIVGQLRRPPNAALNERAVDDTPSSKISKPFLTRLRI